MRDARFCWFAPTAGDFEYLNADEMFAEPSVQHMVEVAKQAETAGFTDILVPICGRCMDPVVVSSYILQATERLNTLIAYKPSITSPQVLGTMLNTLDCEQGRVHLNMVQGDSLEASRQGLDLYEKAEMLSRLQEFSRSLRELLYAEELHEYKGQFYQHQDALAVPKRHASRPPQMFIGGGEFAMRLAAECYDVYLTFGDTVERIGQYAKRAKQVASEEFGRDLKIGMGINVVVRKSRSEAMEACETLISRATKEARTKARFFYMKNKAIGGREYKELEACKFLLEDNLWAGIAKVRFGQVATIYGSYQEVADKLQRYYEAGVQFFSLTGYPLLRETEQVGEVLQLLSS